MESTTKTISKINISQNLKTSFTSWRLQLTAGGFALILLGFAFDYLIIISTKNDITLIIYTVLILLVLIFTTTGYILILHAQKYIKFRIIDWNNVEFTDKKILIHVPNFRDKVEIVPSEQENNFLIRRTVVREGQSLKAGQDFASNFGHGGVSLIYMWIDAIGNHYRLKPIHYYNLNEAFKITRQLRKMFKYRYYTPLHEKIPSNYPLKVIIGTVICLLCIFIVIFFSIKFH